MIGLPVACLEHFPDGKIAITANLAGQPPTQGEESHQTALWILCFTISCRVAKRILT